MEEKLKVFVLQTIKDQGFDITQIKSYSLNRKGNGVYQMIIWFGGRKTQKDDIRYPDIQIGKDQEVAFAVLKIIDNCMVENEKVDIMQSMKLTTKEPKNGESGW